MCPGANRSFPEAELFFLLKAVKVSPGSPVVKNLPAVQETQESRVQSLGWGDPSTPVSPVLQETQESRVQSLGWGDPLEEEMATHCSILSWRTPWTEKPGGLQSMGLQTAGHD